MKRATILTNGQPPVCVGRFHEEPGCLTSQPEFTHRTPIKREAVAMQKTPLTDTSISGAIASDSWAWVELNYRRHAYQARIVEAKVGQDVRFPL